MKIAGLGFRDGATLVSVRDALDLAGAGDITRVALPARKASDPLCGVLQAQGLDLIWVSDEALAAMITPTQSVIAHQYYATGSVAEAAALAVARGHDPRAWLAGPRAISRDRMATAAVALTGDIE